MAEKRVQIQFLGYQDISCLRTMMLVEFYCINTTEFNLFKSLTVELIFSISAILQFTDLVQGEFHGLPHTVIDCYCPCQSSGVCTYRRTWYLFGHAETSNFFCLHMIEDIFALLHVTEHAF